MLSWSKHVCNTVILASHLHIGTSDGGRDWLVQVTMYTMLQHTLRYYLKHLALGTLIKEQVLLVEWFQGLSCNLGFLFGFTSSIIQQIHLDIGSWWWRDGVRREQEERQREWSEEEEEAEEAGGNRFVGLCVCLRLTLEHHQAQVLYWKCACVLPGRDLEPGLGVRPRALITSTSSWPFLSIRPIWTSPVWKGDKCKPHLDRLMQNDQLQTFRFFILPMKVKSTGVLLFSEEHRVSCLQFV